MRRAVEKYLETADRADLELAAGTWRHGFPFAKEVRLRFVPVSYCSWLNNDYLENGSQLDRRRYQENGNRTKVRKAIENFTSEEILGQFQLLGWGRQSGGRLERLLF